ncbi:hypothetical protein P43SY_002442 [Pythium insidiosum]|uniref:Uncharacterized protein n=1 Tax=Pythium insidiosum TaxID=114742 RepID=A0AAD5MDB9_PYTIN|nr:hypothetical protein P43SY_002442 [Pythium insidiosum]
MATQPPHDAAREPRTACLRRKAKRQSTASGSQTSESDGAATVWDPQEDDTGKDQENNAPIRRERQRQRRPSLAVQVPERNTCVLYSPVDASGRKRQPRRRRTYGVTRSSQKKSSKKPKPTKRNAPGQRPSNLCSLQRLFAL